MYHIVALYASWMHHIDANLWFSKHWHLDFHWTGAFLIPYIIMVIFAGFPMMFLELAFGQYGGLGVVSIWKASPLFQGKYHDLCVMRQTVMQTSCGITFVETIVWRWVNSSLNLGLWSHFMQALWSWHAGGHVTSTGQKQEHLRLQIDETSNFLHILACFCWITFPQK